MQERDCPIESALHLFALTRNSKRNISHVADFPQDSNRVALLLSRVGKGRESAQGHRDGDEVCPEAHRVPLARLPREASASVGDSLMCESQPTSESRGRMPS